MSAPLLFVGATGNLGAPVARHMVASGIAVRALVRDADKASQDKRLAGVELVQGDVRDVAAVQSALSGCTRVYSSLSSDSFDVDESVEVVGLTNLCHAAARQDVSWIGYLSGAGDLASETHLRPLAIKARCEQILCDSGIPWTVFKPTHFFESLPMFVRDGRIAIPGKQPHTYHYLACDDYAQVVIAVMNDAQLHNQALTLLGPEALTMRQALEIYRDALYPGQKVGQLPLWMMRTLGRMTGNADIRRAAELFSAFRAQGDEGAASQLPATVPPINTTCQQWCQQQAST
tara:strand:- start:136931 stop:137797 length:867 start_codon:yes stop_codon:yes gene_type:complete